MDTEVPEHHGPGDYPGGPSGKVVPLQNSTERGHIPEGQAGMDHGLWLFFFFLIYFLIFIYLVAPGLSCVMQVFSCSMWDLVP